MADYTLSVEVTGDATKMQRAFEKAIADAEQLKEKMKQTSNQTSKDFQAMQDKIEQVSNKMKSIGSAVSNVGSSMMGIGGAMTAGITTPIVGGVALAVKSFAGLEQAVGGIETLFGKSAKAVIKNSESAYKRAGISGTKYMEQVTSFSATLLQGLGGDTAKASAYADKAIVDMSDNANKFGTSMELIQNAYQGFAKQNYTMLDNLKLGYGGTKEEMARLLSDAEKLPGAMGKKFDLNNYADVIEAIHLIQENLGVAGTTSEEASKTVSGSFDAMKASAQNLVDNLGSKNADVKKLVSELEATVRQFAMNVGDVLKTMWDNIPLEPWQKWGIGVVAIAGPVLLALGSIVVGVGNLITAFGIIGGAISTVSGWFATATAEGGALAGVFGSLGAGTVIAIFAGIVVAIAGLVGAFKRLWDNSEQFRASVGTLAETIKIQFGNILNAIMPIVDPVIALFKQMWDTLVTLLEPVISALIPIITSIISIIGNTITTILAIVVPIFTALVQYITAWIAMVTPILSTIIGVVMLIITAVVSAINVFVTTASAIIQALVSAIGAIIAPVVDFFAGIFNAIATVVKNVFTGISNFITTSISTIGNVVNKLVNVFSSVFSGIKGIVNSAMSGVTGAITGAFNKIKSSWSGLTGFVQGVFNGISSAVASLVGQVKGFVNGVIGGINSAVSLINKIPGVSISAIPYLYRGTDNWQGGFARMNEGGRGELTYLPGGSVVVPHDISMKYAKESARSQSGMVMVGGNDEIAKNALKVASDAVKRPTVLNVNGRDLAYTTGSDFSSYQNNQAIQIKRLRGDI